MKIVQAKHRYRVLSFALVCVCITKENIITRYNLPESCVYKNVGFLLSVCICIYIDSTK